MRISNRLMYSEEWEEFLQISKKRANEYTPEDEARVVYLRKLFSDARGAKRHVTYVMTDPNGNQYVSHTVSAMAQELGCIVQTIDNIIRRGRRVAKGQFKGCTFEKRERQSHVGKDGLRYWVEVSSLIGKEPIIL